MRALIALTFAVALAGCVAAPPTPPDAPDLPLCRDACPLAQLCKLDGRCFCPPHGDEPAMECRRVTPSW